MKKISSILIMFLLYVTTVKSQLQVDTTGYVGVGVTEEILEDEGADSIMSHLSVLRSGDSETSVCISAHNMIPAIDEGTLYIQNQTLTSGGYYKANSIIVGKNVTQNQPQGNVNFSHGKFNLDGNKVILHSGTNISVGAIMKIGNR